MPSPEKPDNSQPPTSEVKPTEAEYRAATENLWKTYHTINEWIRFADAKAGAVLTVNGLLVGAAVDKMNAGERFQQENWLYGLALVLALACGGYLIASANHCLRCIEPNLKTLATAPFKKSTLFFEHISQYEELTNFETDTLGAAEHEAAFKEIARQVHEVSKVATLKHKEIIKSVKYLKIGLLLGVALLWILTGLTLFAETK